MVDKWGELPEVLKSSRHSSYGHQVQDYWAPRKVGAVETADNSELRAIGQPGRTLQRLRVEQELKSDSRF